MTKIAIAAAVCAAFTFAAPAFALVANDTPCGQVVQITVEGEAVTLPAEVALQVEKLMSYGDRYLKVVRLVIEENAKPVAFGPVCGPDEG